MQDCRKNHSYCANNEKRMKFCHLVYFKIYFFIDLSTLCFFCLSQMVVANVKGVAVSRCI